MHTFLGRKMTVPRSSVARIFMMAPSGGRGNPAGARFDRCRRRPVGAACESFAYRTVAAFKAANKVRR